MVGRPRGHKLSEETKQKIRESRLGQEHSEETRKKIGDSVRFRKNTRTGIPIDILMETDLSQVTRQKTQRGYITLFIYRGVMTKPYQIREHVAIIEQELGRKLKSGEEVHHWGARDDNRREMLYLCEDRQEHLKMDKIKKQIDKLSSVIVLTSTEKEE